MPICEHWLMTVHSKITALPVSAGAAAAETSSTEAAEAAASSTAEATSA